MTSINPYLTFNGNCEEAFNFYRSIFGGEFTSLSRFGEAPSETPLPESEAAKIMHVALPIGAETVLMGSDSPSTMDPVTIGSNVQISVETESEEETTRTFNGLAAGGQVTMPLDRPFWGGIFGILVDKFGIQWMVSYAGDQPTQDL